MDLRVLRIVVASPGDVKPERDTVSKVVEEVNRNIARERGLHLDVYRWETDSYPGFHPQGPQGLIDPQLKIEDCDLLIGIFWRRFGKPVSDAKSGTEHEFRIAYKTWKKKRKPQIMMYFSQKKYFAQSTEETVQAGLVLQFKKDFPPEGLWWDYKNKSEFENFLRNHLTQFLQEQSPIEIKSEKKQPETSLLTPLFQLPPPPADFTGRTAELAELRAAIEKGGVHISGLQGQGGVGKTALALKFASELAPNYPDAQIYLDLKGVSEKPLTAAEAMSHVLRTFHPEAKLPEKEEDLRALYLSALHNKRALLLMDNAKDAAQVKPLIPPASCALLMTSRQHFALPGLQAKNLETLPPLDAKDLLLRITPRIGGEAEAVAKLCGYLPQALRLAASAIAVRVNLNPHDYAKQLADEKKRLELLTGDDESVEASITLSYNLIDPETQKRWRVLAVFPDTFDAPAAAAIWELETDPVRDALGDLLKFSMLEWNEATSRYRLHDLMRAFARGRLNGEESDTSAFRHALHYLRVLANANELFKGQRSLMHGLALFDLEWGNIHAGQTWAATRSENNRRAAAVGTGYPWCGAHILNLRQRARDRIYWLEPALAAARELKIREAEANHLGALGLAYEDIGEYQRAIEYAERSLEIHRNLGNREAEGAKLGALGNVHLLLGDHPGAVKYFEQHLAIAREFHDRRSEGMALGNIAHAFRGMGESSRAVDYNERYLSIARDIGDIVVEGIALNGLGISYEHIGDHHRAAECHERHLAICYELKDERGESAALGNLGNVYRLLQEHRRALQYFEKDLDISRKIGNRHGEANTSWNMSLSLYELGEQRRAIEFAQTALELYEQIGVPDADKVRKQLDIWRNS